MLQTEEIIDIAEIARARKAAGRELDAYDNLSWHIALKEDGKILGVARLYMYNGGLMADKPCLYKYAFSHYELLVRTLLLKAVTLKTEKIYAPQDGDNIKFGFKPCGGGIMSASYKDIVFPDLCGGCK
jgi:hypothetical protein